jgi:hypothetical protein
MEPLRGHRGEAATERPHIVFKRSARHGTKKIKGKRKKRHEKTCGTRGEGENEVQPIFSLFNDDFFDLGII